MCNGSLSVIYLLCVSFHGRYVSMFMYKDGCCVKYGQVVSARESLFSLIISQPLPDSPESVPRSSTQIALPAPASCSISRPHLETDKYVYDLSFTSCYDKETSDSFC